MKCAHCLGLGYMLRVNTKPPFTENIDCQTCEGTGQIRPPYTLLYDPKKDLVERYDREIR